MPEAKSSTEPRSLKVLAALSLVAVLLGAGSLGLAMSLQASISSIAVDIGQARQSLNQVAEAAGVPLGNPEELQKVLAAKKEGVVMLYTSLRAPDLEKFIVPRFQSKYPGIDLKYVRLSGEDLTQRILTEGRAGRYVADVVHTQVTDLNNLKKEKMLLKYLPREAGALAADYLDPDGYWVNVRMQVITPAYNAKLVSKEDLPKSWNDFLDPKWKGKIGMDIDDPPWMAYILSIMGRDDGLQFLKKLADQQPKLYKGHSLTADLLAAGEFAISPHLYAYVIEQLKAKKAPVEWFTIGPTLREFHGVAVLDKAPHPAAAKLFTDWLMSEEGQAALRDAGYIPTRIKPEPPGLVEGMNFFRPDPRWVDQYNWYVEKWNEIFGIK